MKESNNSNGTLQVLKNTELLGQQFTVYGSAEQPLFLAKDVAAMINHSNVSRMLDMIDDEEKVKIFCRLPEESSLTKGYKPCESVSYVGANRMFVTEDGLYEILMQSNLPIAKEFKKGVKAILKEIRKTGGYISASSDDTPEQIMARALKVADETLKRREQQLQMAQSQIEEQRKEIQDLNPYADYTKEVLQSDSTYTLTQVSKDLGFKSVYAFLEWAKEKDYLFRQSNMWMPTSRVSGRGFFTTRTAKYFKSDGSVGSSLSTVVTERGRAFLHTSLNEH